MIGFIPPSGWYADPDDPSRMRFWDGVGWAEQHSIARRGEDQSASLTLFRSVGDLSLYADA